MEFKIVTHSPHPHSGVIEGLPAETRARSRGRTALSLILAGSLVLALAACSSGGSSGSKPAPTPPQDFLQFDGVDDSVDASDSDALDLAGGAFTIAAWINMASWGQDGEGTIIDHGGSGSGAAGWGFHVAEANQGLLLATNDTQTFSSDPPVQPLAPGAWQHVAVTFAGGVASFFVDGVLTGTQAGVPAPLAQDIAVRIGARAADGAKAFDGAIGDVWVLSEALTQREIRALRDGDFSPSNPAVVASYRFDEGTGQSANDSSPNAYDANLGVSIWPDDSDPVWVTVRVIVPPALSTIQVAPGATSATITWQTDIAADSTVTFGPTIAYESGTASNPDAVTAHSVDLTGLTPDTLYHFRVTSVGLDGGTSISGDRTFRTPALSGLFSTDFNAFDLDGSVWELVDPFGDASLAMVGTNTADAQCRLSVTDAYSHDPWTAGNHAPRILQAANDVDLFVEAKFDSFPSDVYQTQGISVEQDERNFIRFEIYRQGSALRIYSASLIDLVPAVHVERNIAFTSGPLYLRVERTGDHWTQWYSNDGLDWKTGASFDLPFNVAKVGLMCGNYGPSADPPAFTALFDYFSASPGFEAADDATAVTDNLGPFIYHIAAVPLQTGDTRALRVTWDTDEPGDSRVAFGTTPAYEGGTISNAALVAEHSLRLEGLLPDTTYYLLVGSQDAGGHLSERAFVATTAFAGPAIDFWYGHEQQFGNLGTPQRWVNILGNVADPTATLSFTLNGGPDRPLTNGPTDRRLGAPGDFNCEIAVEDMVEGANEVIVKAVATGGATSFAAVNVQFTSQNVWPLPYYVANWGAVQNIQDVCQVTDGLWELTPAGLRTIQIWYDRLVAIGERTWTDYEVLVPITIHAIDTVNGNPAPSKGPAVGVITLWTGHTVNPADPTAQPVEDYRTLGGIGCYRWNASGVFEQEIYVTPGTRARHTAQTITFGNTYWFRFRTVIEGGIPHYYFNLWEDGTAEPEGWEQDVSGPAGSPVAGSMLLFAHHVDATFGPVTVTPVAP